MKIKSVASAVMTLVLLALPYSASAGHLFTQASTNTPTWIQAGQGIAIQQFTVENNNFDSGSEIEIDFEEPTDVPAGADTSTSDWWEFSTGDVLRLNLPLEDATYTYTFAFDASESCQYDQCGGDVGADYAYVDTPGLFSSASIVDTVGEDGDPKEGDGYFTWSVTAVAGEFSLAGYRIYTADGIIDGTGAGPLTQDSVISAEEADDAAAGVVSSARSLKPSSYTAEPDLIPSNVPTCVSSTFVSGVQVLMGGDIKYFAEASKQDHCFNEEDDVSFLPEGMSAKDMGSVTGYLTSVLGTQFDVYKLQ